MHMVVKKETFKNCNKEYILNKYAPDDIDKIGSKQSDIPELAKNISFIKNINAILPVLPTYHEFHLADATNMNFLEPESVHLVVTSPPYWTLKKYNSHERQLGDFTDYEAFLIELKKVWESCYKALVSGGRLICVVGDVCLSRRNNNGRHTVVPLHASIQEMCRKIGFDNLAPIIWHKISNASYESNKKTSFLGKPYEPNGIIKNDIEYILMERKPGGYRSPSAIERTFSVISNNDHKEWFSQIWNGLTGASTKNHPAPYPIELARRLIRMFSFTGDIILDPFLGSGTTSIAAWLSGRNSIGVEVDERYFEKSIQRFKKESCLLTSNHQIEIFK
ncbi:MAG: site-specific DNA-methyltransferase [Spirochaetales bacterium]|nr:site-specific DNA-methyltransferase [Spirochaetales bacterium]